MTQKLSPSQFSPSKIQGINPNNFVHGNRINLFIKSKLSFFMMMIFTLSFFSKEIKSQEPITINHWDIPMPSVSYPFNILGNTGQPTLGSYLRWNYSEATIINSGVMEFPAATDSVFKGFGVDRTFTMEKTISIIKEEPFIQILAEQWDYNKNGIFLKPNLCSRRRSMSQTFCISWVNPDLENHL